MAKLTIMSLNGEDMIDLIPGNLADPIPGSAASQRGGMLGELILSADPDIVGLVEAPPDAARTEKFISLHLNNAYDVYQAEKRGTLGLAFLVRKGLKIKVVPKTKSESLAHFEIKEFDADGDGIKEIYGWANRVPFEAVFSGTSLKAPATFILIHSKSKGAFIPGDLFAYERLSRANRMKQRAQASAVRRRLDALVDEKGKGRVVVMGDMNDGPEFDVYSALLGGAFLEPIMGSIWDPPRIFHNPHRGLREQDRWTIDFKDRVVNPLGASKFGAPTELRSWIDHILVSPELRESVVPSSARILHHRPKAPARKSAKPLVSKPTDHHPPLVTLDL
jgi:exonuclease III